MKLIKKSDYIIYPFLVVLISLLQSCAIGGKFLDEANSFKNVKQDEVIVVGRVTLIPKLEKDEQELNPSGVFDVMGYGDKNKNRSMIQFNSTPSASGYKLVMNPELGKLFFFKVPRNMKYIVDGQVLTEFSRHGNTGQIQLPTGFIINIKSSDKAIYIGDIKYKRDDFNSITSVELTNNYKKAQNEFIKKFGKKYNLRKSLIEKIK